MARDREMDNPFTKDLQIAALRSARAYRGDRLIRVATPHRLLDPTAGPLIAVRLNVITRKTLGGLHTDLDGRVLAPDGEPLPGLYAAGEVAGFGGGGMHGYRSLEGTFLGGCLFSGRVAGRAAAPPPPDDGYGRYGGATPQPQRGTGACAGGAAPGRSSRPPTGSPTPRTPSAPPAPPGRRATRRCRPRRSAA